MAVADADLWCAAADAARLGEQGLEDVAVDVGEAAVNAVVAESKAGVVEAEQVEERGVDVVTVDRIFDGLVAPFVG